MLQSYFDLLGELMKFNIDAFKRFNKYINTDEKVNICKSRPRGVKSPSVAGTSWDWSAAPGVTVELDAQ